MALLSLWLPAHPVALVGLRELGLQPPHLGWRMSVRGSWIGQPAPSEDSSWSTGVIAGADEIIIAPVGRQIPGNLCVVWLSNQPQLVMLKRLQHSNLSFVFRASRVGTQADLP